MGVRPRHHDLARFQRLAQGFEDGAGKLGQFVHEQHAVMGEADLSGLGPSAAAHDGGHGRGVVGVAERRLARDAAVGQHPRQGLDHRGFQRLGRRQFRHQPRKARGQHRLAGPRRPHHQQVVPPRRRDLQRTLGAFLAPDVGHVGRAQSPDHLPRRGRRERRAARQVIDRLPQPLRRNHRHRAHPRGLGPAGGRADQHPPFLGRGHRGGQRARDRDQPPVQRQFPQRHHAFKLVRGQHLQHRQHRKRNGQVEMRTLLGQVGGRQVHRDALVRHRDRHGAEGRADTLARLADGLVGQADDGEGRQPGRDRRLHLDQPRLDPVEGHGIGDRDHVLPRQPLRQGLAGESCQMVNAAGDGSRPTRASAPTGPAPAGSGPLGSRGRCRACRGTGVPPGGRPRRSRAASRRDGRR